MTDRVLPLLLALSVLAAGENPTAHPRIRTQMVRSSQLAPDPRAAASLGATPGPGWMVFDKQGYLSEIGSVVKGSPAGVEHRKLDARGRPVETTTDSASVPTRNEYKDGQFGPVEVDQFQGNQLVKKTLNQFDSRGRCLLTESFNAAGQPLDSVKYAYDAQGHNTQIITQTWNPGDAEPKTYFRQDDTYDSDGNLKERVEYGRDGEALRSLTFGSDFQVSTWWQKAGVTFAQPLYAGHFDSKTQVNTNYELATDGKLFKIVDTHDKAADVDSIQRFDDAGNLVEKLSFRYQRDQAGNWTKRIVSVWDPNSNAMIDVREDDRTLTYY